MDYKLDPSRFMNDMRKQPLPTVEQWRAFQAALMPWPDPKPTLWERIKSLFRG